VTGTLTLTMIATSGTTMVSRLIESNDTALL
jgi:hypothetical protein